MVKSLKATEARISTKLQAVWTFVASYLDTHTVRSHVRRQNIVFKVP